MNTSEVASDECTVDDTGEDGELSKVRDCFVEGELVQRMTSFLPQVGESSCLAESVVRRCPCGLEPRCVYQPLISPHRKKVALEKLWIYLLQA